MKSLLQTAPSMLLKIRFDSDSRERVIGYASGLSLRVSQGQKAIYTVDSPFPIEIAQGMGPASVSGSLSVFLPKGQTLESMGLVASRQAGPDGSVAWQAYSRYFTLRLYDRTSRELVYSIDQVKVSDYGISVQARSVVRCDLTFTAMYATPGNSR